MKISMQEISRVKLHASLSLFLKFNLQFALVEMVSFITSNFSLVEKNIEYEILKQIWSLVCQKCTNVQYPQMGFTPKLA